MEGMGIMPTRCNGHFPQQFPNFPIDLFLQQAALLSSVCRGASMRLSAGK